MFNASEGKAGVPVAGAERGKVSTSRVEWGWGREQTEAIQAQGAGAFLSCRLSLPADPRLFQV